MTVDMFLKLDGVEGESRDASHKDEIDVLAWSWGASNTGTAQTGGGRGAGKTSVQDLTFTHYIDAATTTLLQRTFDGKHIAEGTLVVRQSGESPREQITIKMTDIVVVGVVTEASADQDRLTETVELSFAQIDYTYLPQLSEGQAGAATKAGWNIPKNDSTV